MPAVGGSITEISMAGRAFAVPADAEAQRKMGGWENEVLANGAGGARIVKTKVPLALDGLTVEVDDSRGDAEFIQDLQNGTDFFDLAVTFASGITYQARAMITGETQTSSQSATASVSLMGPGEFTKQ